MYNSSLLASICTVNAINNQTEALLDEYIELVDLTGRQMSESKRGQHAPLHPATVILAHPCIFVT